MRHVSLPLRSKLLLPVATLLALAAISAQPLQAQAERESTSPIDWTAGLRQTVANINGKLAEGYRIVNLDYAASGPLFAITYVRNEGEYYQRGAVWYYGTVAYISSQLSGKRITELEPYYRNDTLYFAAALVDNTGSQAKTWWWAYGTQAHISNQLSGRRIVDLDAYRINGTVYYSAVMIANTGADYRDWWWYPNATSGYIITQALALNAQILDAERFGYGSADEHCGVLVRHPSRPVPDHAWFHWKDETEVAALLAQHRARPVKIESLGVLANGTRIFNLLLIENRGSIDSFGRSCSGSSGTPTLTVSGTAQINGSVNLRLARGPSNQPAILAFGLSSSSWGGVPMPISLSGLGASGCYLYIDQVALIARRTATNGTLSQSVNIPLDFQLGTKVYAQMICFDRLANALGVTTTNAVEIWVGQ